MEKKQQKTGRDQRKKKNPHKQKTLDSFISIKIRGAEDKRRRRRRKRSATINTEGAEKR